MNSSDRELLELAAKAARYNVIWSDVDPDLCWLPGIRRDYENCWNPLIDDGDALRLAVVLGLTVECDFHDSDTCTASETRGEILADESSGMSGEIIGAPEFSATRLAIVRAAAEIGRSMP